MKTIEKVTQILANREGVDYEEMEASVKEGFEKLQQMIDEGAGLLELEEFFQNEFGLEPDYLEEWLMSMI